MPRWLTSRHERGPRILVNVPQMTIPLLSARQRCQVSSRRLAPRGLSMTPSPPFGRESRQRVASTNGRGGSSRPADYR
jgi:hypothetical protein